MIYTELLNRAFLRDGENPGDNDDENLITLMPKGAAPGIEFDVVISRTDFEDAFTRSRREDPIFEAILTELAPSRKRPIRDRFWRIFTGVQAFKDTYARLAAEYLEAGLNLAASKESALSTSRDTVEAPAGSPLSAGQDIETTVESAEIKEAERDSVIEDDTLSGDTGLESESTEPADTSPLDETSVEEIPELAEDVTTIERQFIAEHNITSIDKVATEEDSDTVFGDGYSLAPPAIFPLEEDNSPNAASISESLSEDTAPVVEENIPNSELHSMYDAQAGAPLDNAEFLMGLSFRNPFDMDTSNTAPAEGEQIPSHEESSIIAEPAPVVQEPISESRDESSFDAEESVDTVDSSASSLEPEIESEAVVTHSTKSADELMAEVDGVITDLLSACSQYGIPLVLYGDKNAKKCVRRFAVTIAENVPPLTKILMESDSIKDSIKNLAYLCSVVRKYCEPLAETGDEKSIDKILEPIIKAIYQ